MSQPAYRQRLGERLGYYPFQLDQCIWIHAVSVGESIAAVPLIKSLQTQYPGTRILVTTMTPTGAERIRQAFADSVSHVYIPYDLPFAMQRFINSMNPLICLIMETELWPNLLAACHANNIPVCLLNARLSEKSARGYQKIAWVTRNMLSKLDLIAAHGEADANRFLALGAIKERMQVTGNIKFDIQISADIKQKSVQLREALGTKRFIWIAASTHEGEDEIILAAHAKLRALDPQALLILVPRHPARFDAMAKLAGQTFVVARRSVAETCTDATGVYLGDTMGELLVMYGAADVAFVAGSLIPRGGHNMLEPGALAKPILTGMHLFNFAEISEKFVTARAMIKVADADSLAAQLIQLMQHPDEQQQMGARALQVVMENRGALEKQVKLVSEFI